MKQHIYVIGDIHGGWQPIRDFVQRAPYLFRQKNANDENILICLGDFGGTSLMYLSNFLYIIRIKTGG